MEKEIEKKISYPPFYIQLIIFTILLDKNAITEIRPIFGSLFDEINDEYETLKEFVKEHKKEYGINNQMVMVERIRESKLYEILQKICKEGKYISILKKSYNISRLKWKDLDGQSDEGMKNFSMLKNEGLEGISKNNCICGKAICDNVIIHHKTLDTKIVIGNVCVEGYDNKEVIFGKIDGSEFHTWIKSLFNCINVIKKDNGTLEHFKKSKPFIEKCLNDRIITEEEKDKYEEYPKLYIMRKGVYTLLIENYSDLNIITSLFKKICDEYLHPSREEYKEKYKIENILFNENENIKLRHRDLIVEEYLREKMILQNCKYRMKKVTDEDENTEYILIPESIIFRGFIGSFSRFSVGEGGFIDYHYEHECTDVYFNCIDCNIYCRLDISNKVFGPRCPDCWGRENDRPNSKYFTSFKNPLTIQNKYETCLCSECHMEIRYNVLKRNPITYLDQFCRTCV